MFTSHAANFSPPNGAGAYGVGFRVIQQYDRARVFRQKTDLTSGAPAAGERARPLQTLVWYPAGKSAGRQLHYRDYLGTTATETLFERSATEAGRVVARTLEEEYANLSAQQARTEMDQPMLALRDAPAAPGTFPVVIYAPGSSSPAHENADLCEYLASHGYVVMASASMGVDTRGITIDLDGAEAQAADIGFLVGHAATVAQADRTRIAVVGYSFGGLANVLAAARDDRIGALVALDGSVRYHPSIAQAAAYATPERLALPMLYMGGKPATAEAMNRNGQVPAYSLLNRMKYADLYNVTMYTMAHAAFQSESLRLGPEGRFGEYSRDEAALAYGWMEKYVLAFLDAHLKGDAQALQFMQAAPKANGVPAHLLAVDVHRAEGAPPTLATLAAAFAARGHAGLAAVYRDMSRRAPDFKPAERALISWGEPFLEQQRYAQAIDIFALANALYPDSWRAAFYLAMAYDRNRDNAHAIEQYERVLGYWPDMAEARQSIVRLRAQAPGTGAPR
ncbi:dienelactone hydrolase [Massilia forsythiae]|uniref:Dienelactone hydrolase n=1 Tax=Massilia forsythiae TaxID=2728020 RepID=A0A7Z2W1J6_9BURK|nr:dienelactone hydrolase family protein [Massilia forsythiae]QJE02767.1 dienelactone hydrolase [Massilia forsythiae]